ncbi:MAG: hypothetical protein WD035_08925 [Balneolaceae bacterium]
MRWNKKTYTHKLAVIGDSMGQGFQNGGIYRTDLSFPALLVRCFEPPTRFEVPSFSAQGGIPLNLEVLVRGLSEEFGNTLTWKHYVPAGIHLIRTLKRIKNHWEGSSRDLRVPRSEPWHNQSIWGFAAKDSWMMTEKLCRKYIRENKPQYTIFNVLPDQAMYITGRLVLNPSFKPEYQDDNQLENIRRLHEDGGVENLIVCTGHNNFVGALSALKLVYTKPDDLGASNFNRSYTVYRPEHFEKEMRGLFEKIGKLDIPNIVVPTYPYITIPPVTRGVNESKEKNHDGYFDYYTRFWIWDEDFNPNKHPHLNKNEAIELDQLVDQYNNIIRSLSKEYGFIVAPVHRYVNAVARRRLGVNTVRPFPPAFIEALKRNSMTSHLVTPEGRVKLSTDYLRIDDETHKLMQGGIFSLDGLHPSTIGYGLIANIYRMSMAEAGVKFDKPIDWDFVIESDTLVSDPPYLLAELRQLLRFLSLGRQERFVRFGKSLLQRILETFTRQSEQV